MQAFHLTIGKDISW